MKGEFKFTGNEIENNIEKKCRYEQVKKNTKELNSIGIHLEIHIAGSDKIENSPAIDNENEYTDEGNKQFKIKSDFSNNNH